MAPEILKKEEYNQNIDIWALGITCIEMAEYEPPYSKLTPTQVIKQIIKSPPKGLNNPYKWSKEFNDFISRCLEIDKFKRPLADELLKHDFITMIDKKNLNRKYIILQFISKCGYNVLYNRKTKLIVPPTHIVKSNRSLFNKNTENNEAISPFIFKKLNHKSSIENIYSKKNIINLSNACSTLNINTNNSSCNYNLNKNLGNNDIRSSRHNISLKCSSIFSKKICLRTRSVERDSIDKNQKYYNYKPCLTTTSDKKNNLTPGLRNIYYKSNLNIRCSDLNENNDSIKEEDEILDNEKIYDDEIKTLMKERNEAISNIILKYEDKISQMKHDKNIYLKKSLHLDDSGVKNKLDEKSKIKTKKNGNYSYRKKVNTSCSLNKIKTGIDDEKSKKLYLIID